MRNKLNFVDLTWWLGVPVVVFLCIWAPYWIWSLVSGQASWLRIPITAGVIFDVTAYLQSVGQAMHGLPAGSLLGPFTHLVRGLHSLFPEASVTEVWFISRWMCESLTVWLTAWVMKEYAGVSTRRARLFSIAMWLSYIIVLGMKPAVFSWFLPGGVVGIGAVLMMHRHLTQGHVLKACLWFLSALVLSSSYAWYLIFVALFGSIVWFRWCISFSRKLAGGLAGLAALGASVSAIVFSFWVTQNTAGIIFLELYQRLSLSYTHLPFLSSSLFLSLLWGSLLIPFLSSTSTAWKERIWLAFIAWVSLVFCFWLSPFTGHFILNDHFRAPAVILSWLTLALVWEGYAQHELVLPAKNFIKGLKYVPYLTLAVSGLYILRILAAPYAWNNDFLNILQLSHWFALFVASCLVLQANARKKLSLQPRTFFAGVFVCLGVFAAIALSAVYTREFSLIKRLQPILPLVEWIKTHVPVTDEMCTDHGGEGYSLDDMLAAHTGRVVHMAHVDLYNRERDRAYLDRMRIMSGFYDVRGAGDEEYWKLQSSLNQFIICENFPIQRRILKAVGIAPSRIDAIIGCPTEVIDARWKYVKQAILQPQPDAEAFKKRCPWVVMSPRTRPFWHLPQGYREESVTPDLSVFTIKSL